MRACMPVCVCVHACVCDVSSVSNFNATVLPNSLLDENLLWFVLAFIKM